MTDILELLAAADPAHPQTPIDELLTGGHTSTGPRRPHMTVTTNPPTTTAPPPRRPWVAVAAAAIVVVAIGAVALSSRSEAPDVADLPDTPPVVDPVPMIGADPSEVLGAFVQRIDDGDLTGALSLYEGRFATRVESNGWEPGPIGRAWALYFIAADGTIDARCEPGPEPDTARCAVTAEDSISRALGLAPAEYSWSATVVDGLIVDSPGLFATVGRAGAAEDPETPYGAALATFDAWARDTHLDRFLSACRGTAAVGNFQSWNPACADFRMGVVDEFAATAR